MFIFIKKNTAMHKDVASLYTIQQFQQFFDWVMSVSFFYEILKNLSSEISAFTKMWD